LFESIFRQIVKAYISLVHAMLTYGAQLKPCQVKLV